MKKTFVKPTLSSKDWFSTVEGSNIERFQCISMHIFNHIPKNQVDLVSWKGFWTRVHFGPPYCRMIKLNLRAMTILESVF